MSHPGIEAIRALWTAGPDRHSAPLAARRAGMEAFAALMPLAAGVRVEPGAIGGIPGEIVRFGGGDARSRVILVHGGAYVAGSPASHRPLAALIAERAEAAVFAVDYRLAPEHPFPAAVEDVAAVLRAAGPTVVVGDSAGAGAALAATTLLRDADEPMPLALALISPWLDLSCTAATFDHLAADDFMLSRAGLLSDAAYYLGGADPAHPLASPLNADAAGLPPTLVQAGGRDVLIDDARAWVARARAAGVKATLSEWPGMIHVWHAFRAHLPEADQAIDEVAAYLRAALTKEPA